MENTGRISELWRTFSCEPIVNIPVPFNFELRILDKGFAVVQMNISKGMLVGGVGIVNGGMLCTLANTASVYAAMADIPEGHTPCVHFTFHPIKETRAEETLTAVARVVVNNHNSVFVNFTISNRDDSSDVRVVGQAQYLKPRKKS